MNMQEAFQNCGTDKKLHGYLPFYEDAFKDYQNTAKTVLEIGVHEGASLVGWRNYFPNARIIGIEINNSVIKLRNKDRVNIHVGDATNKNFMRDIISKYPKGFDIVIDDGSHHSHDIRRAFAILWPHTNYVYCVEDLATQYSENDFPNRVKRKFGNQFITQGTYAKNMHKYVDQMMESPYLREDIFKLSFYKWQIYIYKNK